MNVAVVGTGYVGLVTSTCLAESGNEVVGIDKDERKVRMLVEEDRIPIYEPGLLELVRRNKREGRLKFTTDLAAAVKSARLIFIAVGTPQSDAGDADLSAVWAVAKAIALALKDEPKGPPGSRVVITKSTVPVGTNARVAEILAENGCPHVDVASNPEFLKEGAAIDDFMKPDRVVVGVRHPAVGEALRELYAPFLRTERPFLVMTPESAEMTKYAANAMLATKISFINEMANLCDRLQANINDVRKGIGHDQRIGFQFLFPGPGYGGSCFPKDIRAILGMGRKVGQPLALMQSVDDVNEAQKQVLFAKVQGHFGDLAGKTFAVWGLAFKPRTDDIREAPALTLIDSLLAAGASVRVHDPEAMANVRDLYGDKLTYCDRPYGAVEGADALVLVTEWPEFRTPDFEVLKRLLKAPVIFDGRNVYDESATGRAGFTYYGIGRGQAMTGPFTVTFRHGGKTPKPGEYESAVTVEGPKTGTFRGSIFPDDMAVKGRIADGRYPLHIGFHRRDKQPKPTVADLCVRTSGFRAALIVNTDKAVPVLSDNPEKKTSTYIHVHNGGAEKRGSEGCQTLPAVDWAKFLKLFLDHYPRLEDWMAVSQYIGVQCGELVVTA